MVMKCSRNMNYNKVNNQEYILCYRFHASVEHEGKAKHIIPKKHKKHHKSHKHDNPQDDKVNFRPHQLPHKKLPQIHKVPINSEYNAPDFDRVPNFDEGPNYDYAPSFNAFHHDHIPKMESVPYIDSAPNFDPVSFYDATHVGSDEDGDSVEVIELM